MIKIKIIGTKLIKIKNINFLQGDILNLQDLNKTFVFPQPLNDGKTNLHMPVDLNFVNIFIGIPSAASSDEVGPSWYFPPLDNKEDKRLVKQLKRHLQSDGKPLFNTFEEDSPACKKI